MGFNISKEKKYIYIICKKYMVIIYIRDERNEPDAL